MRWPLRSRSATPSAPAVIGLPVSVAVAIIAS
jgi:hypothetical protein